MPRKALVLAAACVGLALVAWATPKTTLTSHMSFGNPAVRSLGAMTFGPENVLFVGDSRGATVYALDVDDDVPAPNAEYHLSDVDALIAAALGTATEDIAIHDMAVHPTSQKVYFTITRGLGDDGQPVLVRIDPAGNIEEVSLDGIRFSEAAIMNAPDPDQTIGRRQTPARTQTVTDLAYADGQVFVAGLSNEEFSSNLRRLPFPFTGDMSGTGLEIYHVSHGQNETHAPVMTFMPHDIADETHILAAYTCTPLVAFPVEDLRDGAQVFGRTVAELGAGNRPLDIISYRIGGEERILVANSRHPLMKIDPQDLVDAPTLTSPTRETGIGFVPIQESGIVQLDNLNDEFVIVLQGEGDGLYLHSFAKADL